MISKLIKKIKDYIFGKGLGGEAFRYLVVGGLTTLIDFCLFVLMHEVMGIDSTVSNITSISIAILFAYVTNKLIVFKKHSESATALVIEFIKFVGSRLFTMALAVGVVWLFESVLGLSATLGKAVSQILVVITNYFISKIIVFREKQ